MQSLCLWTDQLAAIQGDTPRSYQQNCCCWNGQNAANGKFCCEVIRVPRFWCAVALFWTDGGHSYLFVEVWPVSDLNECRQSQWGQRHIRKEFFLAVAKPDKRKFCRGGNRSPTALAMIWFSVGSVVLPHMHYLSLPLPVPAPVQGPPLLSLAVMFTVLICETLSFFYNWFRHKCGYNELAIFPSTTALQAGQPQAKYLIFSDYHWSSAIVILWWDAICPTNYVIVLQTIISQGVHHG